jgi:hypothetical protein
MLMLAISYNLQGKVNYANRERPSFFEALTTARNPLALHQKKGMVNGNIAR